MNPGTVSDGRITMEAVLEPAGLLSTHPEDPRQTLTTCTERRISDWCSAALASSMERKSFHLVSGIHGNASFHEELSMLIRSSFNSSSHIPLMSFPDANHESYGQS
ncbi:hypothetical protein EYF80_017802 [Liparis tanakae]|uniref:Uncharacterized protein n=1 Tax=Liparis tanakae TaxID=230148 RepID=A0A4Z2I3X2_9TELE|nr:hypothetical protein EYF80_017802 [Liparis tanakae]